MESSLLISGMVIPAMAMPSIFIPPGVESWWLVCSEWQSEFIETNAQERSQAAANEDAHSSIATIEPANIRLIIKSISILRQIISPLQPHEIVRIKCKVRRKRLP
jgi:hypothetical protein